MSEEAHGPQIFEDFLGRLQGVQRHGNDKAMAKCPAHEDRQQSLSVGLGDDGKILIKCFAGCDSRDILARMGLKLRDLFSPGSRPLSRSVAKRVQRAEIVEVYPYRWDHDAPPVFEVCRLDPKSFRQRRPDPDKPGAHVWNLQGIQEYPLYNLPAARDQIASGKRIFFVEGEKDVHALRDKLHAVAVTAAGGAGKWRPEYANQLAGARVVILPDNDPPGRDWALLLSRRIPGALVVNLPGLPPKGDVSDWLAAGGTRAALTALIADAEHRALEAPDSVPVQASLRVLQNGVMHFAADFLDAHRVDGVPTLRRVEGQWWCWANTHYRRLDDERLEGMIRRHFDGLHVWKPVRGGEPVAMPINPNIALVREVSEALPALSGVLVEEPTPCWIDGAKPPRPGARLIPVHNGLLDFELRELHPHDPRYFERWALPFPYDPDVPDPRAWLDFLRELWPGDSLSEDLLQEWFGYIIGGGIEHHKILAIVGPPRSGKGTIAQILRALVGEANVANPTLDSLATQFGPAALVGKPLAIVQDARLSGRRDPAELVGRLLSISGGDPQMLDRKYRDPIPDVRMTCRFTVVSNELPALADASGALASRFLILQTRTSFLGKEDPGLLDRLRAELPGIFNWTLRGLERLNSRERFLQPAAGAEAVRLLAEVSSPVSAFIEEACERDLNACAYCGSVWEAWQRWCEDSGRPPGNKQYLSRLLHAQGIDTAQLRNGSDRRRVYRGIRLRLEGNPWGA